MTKANLKIEGTNGSLDIVLPESTIIKSLSDGRTLRIDWHKVPSHLIPTILERSALVILNNAFNGGGKDQAEADRVKAVERRLGAWYEGNWAITERGDSFYTELKDQWIAEQVGEGKTAKQVEAEISMTVKSTFGEAEKATFGRFLDALATQLAKAWGADYGETRASVESQLAERSAKAKAERAKVKAGLDVSGLALAAFAKPA